MMNQAGFSPWLHKLLWCEVAQTATDIDNILLVENTNAPPFTRFYVDDAKYSKYLQTFLGDVCHSSACQQENKDKSQSMRMSLHGHWLFDSTCWQCV